MISFTSLQGTNNLIGLNIVKDSISIADKLPAPKNIDYSFVVDTISTHEAIITKVHPETLAYTLSDSLFQKFIRPLAFENLPEGYYNFNFISKIQFVENWSIILFVFLLIVLATILVSSEKYIIQLFQSVFNRVVANRLFREKVGNILDVSYKLDFFFFLVIGLFIYQIVYYTMGDSDSAFLLYGICVGAIIAWMTGKFMLYRLTGFIFDTLSETREYIFYLRLGNRIMGLILFPIGIALFFIKSNLALYLLIFGGLIIIFFSFLGLYRGIRVIGQNFFSIYYMILYLCTLEILPLLYVWRILWRE